MQCRLEKPYLQRELCYVCEVQASAVVQDHVVAGVLLCKRDTFLQRAEFMQLVYSAVGPSRPGLKDASAISLPIPTILRPRPLWTGKQVMHLVTLNEANQSKAAFHASAIAQAWKGSCKFGWPVAIL